MPGVINDNIFNPLIKFTVSGDPAPSRILAPKETTYNGKYWYCFDEPSCQEVVYWSVTGPYSNVWVYSLNGLGGTPASYLDNADHETPIYWFTSLETPEPKWYVYLFKEYPDFDPSVDPFPPVPSWTVVGSPIKAIEGDGSEVAYAWTYANENCLSNDICSSDECLLDLYNYFSEEDFIRLLDKGIVETGSISSYSAICQIRDILIDLNPNITPFEVFQYIEVILDAGIVIKIENGCSTRNTSVETYLKDTEQEGLQGSIGQTQINNSDISTLITYQFNQDGECISGCLSEKLPKWRTRWYNDNYGETDVSDVIFTYKIEENLEGGEGYPIIVNYPNIAYDIDYSSGDTYYSDYGGWIKATKIRKRAISINIALNSTNLYSNIYERKLIVEDITGETPLKVLEVDFYGEIVGEDERFDVLLKNLGRVFTQSDSTILRNHDPDEPMPDFLEINEKRKELLVAGEEIYPYIGSYKGLINALRFFGYQDPRIKEYWLNLKYNKVIGTNSIKDNRDFLDQIKASQNKDGYTQNYLISDILDNQGSGKYRLTQTYGPDESGNNVLDLTHDGISIPNNSYKKTSLFGLYYDINKTTGEDSEYGYPEVVDAFTFTQEEVLIKLFGLKERLKRDYLPLNARIIDITGEGVYFKVYNTRAWTDFMDRSDIDLGFKFNIKSNPNLGFLEDLRNFSTRGSSNLLQIPSVYFDDYSLSVSVLGGTGSAIYFSGITGVDQTLPNQTLNLTAGKNYEFVIGTTGFDFYITEDPTLNTIIPPSGLTGNGTVSGATGISWYINPSQTSPVYYYSSQNKTLLNGQINIISTELSDLGNIVEPLSNQQRFSKEENLSMISAIEKFYVLKQEGEIEYLGDSGYDGDPYIDPSTGLQYSNPLGMPVILEMIPDRWQWDEFKTEWSSISLPVFLVGTRVKVKNPNSIDYNSFGTIVGFNYNLGSYTVDLDNFPADKVFYEGELTSTTQTYGTTTWENIDFSNMVEVEWIINKKTNQPGSPYNFRFQGNIVGFHKISHFLPYQGEYDVICNVIDGFNYKSTVIENSSIKVNPKSIKIDAWTRYREVEDYIWEEVYREWNSYKSIWEFPTEGESLPELSKKIPREILDFARYGNNGDLGQEVFIKVKTKPKAAKAQINLSQIKKTVTDISSYLIIDPTNPSIVQYGFAIITTSSNHDLSVGDYVTVIESIDQLNGKWEVYSVLSPTSFQIPVVLEISWDNVITISSSQISVDDSPSGSPNQYIVGSGSISVFVDGIEVGSTLIGDTLENTAGQLISSINSTETFPDYSAFSSNIDSDPVIIEIRSQDDLGSSQNGLPVDVIYSGYVDVISFSGFLSDGSDSIEEYVYWNEYDEYLSDSLKYWGTKRLTWEVFNENKWDDGYAHPWYDFEFNNDWLGGYELHSILPGDNIILSTGSPEFPFPVGIEIQPGATVDLKFGELVDQLNSANDSYITNFYYRPVPTGIEDLPVISPPMNLEFNNFSIPASPLLSPTSSPGGSPLLLSIMAITGGTPITTTTSFVKIGALTWSSVNLDTGNYRDGSPIPQITDEDEWANANYGAWCYYSNTTTPSIKGRLYNWYAVNDPRGIAPEGWHIPSLAEWNYLLEFLGGKEVAGAKLKLTGSSEWDSLNTESTNSSGFSAVGTRFRYSDGEFDTFIDNLTPLSTRFWSSDIGNYIIGTEIPQPLPITTPGVTSGFYTELLNYSNSAFVNIASKGSGFSVRVVKDY